MGRGNGGNSLGNFAQREEEMGGSPQVCSGSRAHHSIPYGGYLKRGGVQRRKRWRKRRSKEKDHCRRKLLKKLEAGTAKTSGRNIDLQQKENALSAMEAEGMKINMNIGTSMSIRTELGHCQEP